MILNEGKTHRNVRPVEYNITKEQCWEATSHRVRNSDRYSYPVVTRHGKKQDMHRYSYELHHGKIPQGMIVRHKCDNPLCINPDHLEIGTIADNNRDTIERGRHKPLQESLPQHVVDAILDYSRSAAQLAEQYGISKYTVQKRRFFARHGRWR